MKGLTYLARRNHLDALCVGGAVVLFEDHAVAGPATHQQFDLFFFGKAGLRCVTLT